MLPVWKEGGGQKLFVHKNGPPSDGLIQNVMFFLNILFLWSYELYEGPRDFNFRATWADLQILKWQAVKI